MHTPFHKFNYVLRFLSEASIDPSVTKISITIYRLSKLSSVANALINAAKNGKEVTVQIELQARFDERANIKYAKLLEEQGEKLRRVETNINHIDDTLNFDEVEMIIIDTNHDKLIVIIAKIVPIFSYLLIACESLPFVK